jgi:hypothetical protein
VFFIMVSLPATAQPSVKQWCEPQIPIGVLHLFWGRARASLARDYRRREGHQRGVVPAALANARNRECGTAAWSGLVTDVQRR